MFQKLLDQQTKALDKNENQNQIFLGPILKLDKFDLKFSEFSQSNKDKQTSFEDNKEP
jgi:hypothetical protein